MSLKRVSICDRVVALRNSVLILPVVLFFLSTSCTKETTILGLGLVPPGDKIVTLYTDTITVYSSILKLDSVASYEIANGIIGSYKDPVFGVVTANIISQISPTDTTIKFGDGPVLDSVVMHIAYSTVYGNKASTVNFKIYQLQNIFVAPDKLNPKNNLYETDTTVFWDQYTFYSNYDITPNLGPEIGSFAHCPAVNGSFISIHLSQQFGDYLLHADTTQIYNVTRFHNYLSGIAIIPDKATVTGDGYVLKTYLGYTAFDIIVYYKNNYLIAHDSSSVRSYTIYNAGRDARFNTFSHDYSSANFLPDLTAPNIKDTMAYMESMSGVITRLSFPGLKDLRGEPVNGVYPVIAINKAELIIPVEPDDTVHYAPSGQMQLLHKNSAGTFVTTPDYDFFNTYVDSLSRMIYVNGYYDLYNRRYIMNVNKHIEYTLAHLNTYDSDLYLRPNSSSTDPFPGRSILKNGTGKNKMKLKITYTKR